MKSLSYVILYGHIAARSALDMHHNRRIIIYVVRFVGARALFDHPVIDGQLVDLILTSEHDQNLTYYFRKDDPRPNRRNSPEEVGFANQDIPTDSPPTEAGNSQRNKTRC
jgi:hypothetical protein